ncbi:hypothetical protein ACFQZQ_08225 [Lysobacter koreensis]|uniref:DUF4148 domain-containing protein n=1 Tax=Lysobacter koreensis TaxID=266122 RepID=A0ABW2YS14_9GAMM
MKAKIAGLLLAIAAAAPAYAADNVVEQLAHDSGLSVRKVQMILGNRTSFAEYPYTYQRSLEKFQARIGKENYNQLMAGQPIKLRNGAEVTRALVIAAR